MDLARAGYRAIMRFAADGSRDVEVTWYFCKDGAQIFPVPHSFFSTNWDDPRRQGTGIGEQWSSSFKFTDGTVPFYAPGTGTFCGKEAWFQDGAPSNAPPITYTDGVPTCCPPNPLPGCIPFFPSNTTAVVKDLTTATTWVVTGPGTTHEIDAVPPGPVDQLVLWFGAVPVCSPGDTSTFGEWFPDLVTPFPLLFLAYDPATRTSTWTPDPSFGPPANPVWTLQQFP